MRVREFIDGIFPDKEEKKIREEVFKKYSALKKEEEKAALCDKLQELRLVGREKRAKLWGEIYAAFKPREVKEKEMEKIAEFYLCEARDHRLPILRRLWCWRFGRRLNKLATQIRRADLGLI
ncbi:hypothetical protein KJ586_01865 [Patescibacteria group bacterium]|nr:hypothetical protein [Patescibacteria group bacterium]MBU4347628.1 hypothetical protein [Patescibacteria group bacterium]MBU4455240.1 hypothetical protein [Patescibacteria group bacterium]MCG2690747.1 hypothetical protein [Candidatus Parcubacteria bacterium]